MWRRTTILGPLALAAAAARPAQAHAQQIGITSISTDLTDQRHRRVVLVVAVQKGLVVAGRNDRFLLEVTVSFAKRGIGVGETSTEVPIAPASPRDEALRGGSTVPLTAIVEVPGAARGVVDVAATARLVVLYGIGGRLTARQTAATARLDVGRRDAVLEPIYGALRVEGFRLERASYTSGEQVQIFYDLVNQSTNTLTIPLNTDHSTPWHLVGTEQYWIERLGADRTIPGIPDIVCRDGTRYAAGGQILVSERSELNPSERLPRVSAIATAVAYPPGTYRVYLEYKRLDQDGCFNPSDGVIQTVSADFQLR
jgi:hypothetical protein